jgi:TPP-dependent indolepyruvate ferredoxin oxidoreductase alpha subunit
MNYRNLIEAMQLIAANVGSQETKLQKKLVKIHEKLKGYYEGYSEALQDLRLDHASVDDKGNVIMNEKGEYSFTKEAMKKLNADIKVLLEKEFDYKVIEVVNPIGLEEHTYLSNFVKGVKFVNDEEEAI